MFVYPKTWLALSSLFILLCLIVTATQWSKATQSQNIESLQSFARTLSINEAEEQELRLIHGIGPSLAKAIHQYRLVKGPFLSWEEVGNVPGIGPATLQKLRERARLDYNPPHGQNKNSSPRELTHKPHH